MAFASIACTCKSMCPYDMLPGCRLSCLCSASGRPDWQLWRHTNSLQEHFWEASVAFLQVLASYGHVRDLPAKSGSVQPDEDFRLLWARRKAAQPRLQEIAQAIREAQTLILATDPDREGEAISWHVQEELAVSSLSIFMARRANPCQGATKNNLLRPSSRHRLHLAHSV